MDRRETVGVRHPSRSASPRDLESGRPSRRQARHRGRFRQGRRRQVHHLLQSRARLCRHRTASRTAGCRHLRPLAAATVRPAGQAAPAGTADAGANGALWRQGDVDRLSGRGRPRHDLARRDGDPGDHADAARSGLGRTRCSRRRSAAGHRRCAAHHGAAGAAVRRPDRLDAAGHRADRRAARHRDVPESERAAVGFDREHVGASAARPAIMSRRSSAMAARAKRPRCAAFRSSARFRSI